MTEKQEEKEQSFVRTVFKVLYAPQKAFKEVSQKPKYLGPILIMILFVAANAGFGYTLLYKSYFDQTIPKSTELDAWTENATLWNSNFAPYQNLNSHINGTYYGNKSIQFSNTGYEIWMQLNITDPINCTGLNGYKNLSFSVRQLLPETKPSNASLYLFSTNHQTNFYHNLTSELNETGVWSNVTLTLGPGTAYWQPSNISASWGNITGLRLEFTWSTNSSIFLLIDGLFFHGLYKSALETASSIIMSYPISAFMQFTLQWIALGFALFALPRAFKTKTEWKPLLIAAGFVLIVLLIQILVYAIIILNWPDLFYSFKILNGVPGASETAYLETFGVIARILWIVERAFYLWAIGLCAVVLRVMFAYSWTKSIFIAALSYLISVLVFHFLAYGTFVL